MRQLLAAWMVVTDADIPMSPRLIGKPGVGKTTLAYAAAKRMGRDVFIMQATLDTRPEDLLVTPVIEGAGRLRYVASPLVSAMHHRRHRHPRRRQSHEREELGQPRAAARQPPLRGKHRGRRQDQSASATSASSPP